MVISIHAPREGCDLGGFTKGLVCGNFNPRTPRGVRLGPGAIVRPGSLDISIHAPREGCDSSPSSVDRWNEISIHAPREGCDRISVFLLGGFTNFNPRTPRGVRPSYCCQFQAYQCISIHAPREGCDLVSDGAEVLRAIFQSTHPARGATGRGSSRRYFPGISIHAPREGCDISLPVISLMLS